MHLKSNGRGPLRILSIKVTGISEYIEARVIGARYFQQREHE